METETFLAAGAEGSLPPVVAAPEQSRFFSLPAAARLVEPAAGSPGVTFPEGFVAAGIAAGLKQSGRPDMGVLAVTPEWRETAVSAGVFTPNAFAAAPVVLTKQGADLGHLIAVAVNSGNANACTGEPGMVVAKAMQTACAEVLGVAPANVAVGSTGIIGVQLDPEVMAGATRAAAAAVRPGGGPDFNVAIMTTDKFPKACAVELELSGGTVRLGLCAKGAGMISPAMATMICAVTTDAALDSTTADQVLKTTVDVSFNRATVDGEMSTNDSVFLLASGASGVAPLPEEMALFQDTLQAMLLRAALMLVADGEGATKIIKLTVRGAATDAEAEKVCRAVADSPLVKTAMNGQDPNWGRVMSSTGAALPGRSLPDASLRFCGVKVVEGSVAAAVSENEQAVLAGGMKESEIELELDLGAGLGEGVVYFSDLGHEYITINAEYHT